TRPLPSPTHPPDAGVTAPRPDAPPPAPSKAIYVPEIGQDRMVPPSPTSCGGGDQTPMLPEAKAGKAPAGEAHGGLATSLCWHPSDSLPLGARTTPILAALCVDADGDGWYDGPCNERYKLYLTRVHVNEEQDWWGGDEFYLVVDDVRHPQADLDDTWDLDE